MEWNGMGQRNCTDWLVLVAGVFDTRLNHNTQIDASNTSMFCPTSFRRCNCKEPSNLTAYSMHMCGIGWELFIIAHLEIEKKRITDISNV